jgi:hypothetical protein
VSLKNSVERVNVDDSISEQVQEEAEVSGQAVHPLRAVWPSQSGVSKVQDLPDLLQNAGE